MDIWAWVHEKDEQLRESGEQRLADIIDRIPEHCCDDEHDLVDALYAEGVPLAQKAKEPWAEVFIRHWYLQSQVLTRNNAKGMLSEAIELLDLSHREDAKGCPQRICAVQDLAQCYAKADGLGFADERLAVSQETLEEIDPSWPCFTCIGSEYVDALADKHDYESALEECVRLRAELAKHDGVEPESVDALLNTQSRALICLGRYDEAIVLLQSKPISSVDGSGGKRTKMLLCLALAHSEQFAKIDEHMVPLNEILKSHTYYNDWAEIQVLLVNANQILFDDKAASTFRLMANKLIDNGSYRCALDQLLMLCTLSVKNNFLFNARLAIETIQTVIPQLNRDCGAQDEFDKIKAEFLSALDNINVETFNDEDALNAFEFSSNDAYAQSLVTFYQNNTDNVSTVSKLAELYSDYGHKEKGLALIKNVYLANQTNPKTVFAYGRFLLNEYGAQALFTTFDSLISNEGIDVEIKQDLFWLYGHAYRKREPLKAIDFFEQYLQLKPDHHAALLRLAWLHSDIEQYAESVEWWNRLIELDPSNESHHWDRLIPATLHADWLRVRQSSEVIGISLEGDEGVVKQKMGSCRIRFDDEQSSSETFYAQRTGPVSATIMGISNLDEPQRYGQELVFSPVALNKLDQQDSEGYDCDSEGYYNHLYQCYRIIESAPYDCYALDGVHPGDEHVALLVAELEKNNFVFDQRSNEKYRLEFEDDSGKNQDELGFYAYVLLPPNGSKTALHEVFERFSQTQKHPFVWPKLLEELELVDLLKEQSVIEKHYGL